MLNLKSIKWSLNGVHVIAMCLFVPILVTFGFQIKREKLKRKADFQLSKEAVQILSHKIAHPESDTPIPLTKTNLWYLIADAQGNTLEKTENAPAQIATHIPIDTLDKRWTATQRVHFYPAIDKQSVLVVGQAKAPIDAKLFRVTVGYTLVLVTFCPFIIYLSNRSANRALKPIDDMTRIAGSIRDGNFEKRLKEDDAKTELKELTKILNEAFDHIDNTLNIQRQFTSNASHELRTPISILLLELESAIGNDLSRDELDIRLTHCVETAKKMEQLANSMLKIARLESGEISLHKVEINLAKGLEANLQSLRPLVESKGISLTHELSPIDVKIDTDAFAQIITNLISNAVSHTSSDGSIHVTLSKERNQAKIAITDTGSGIPARDLPHIFNRFYRADKARSATENRSGLGLAICQSIILAHDGTIRIDSVEGEETTIFIYLPI